MHHLYCITIHINNKKYIGQTVDPRKRWDQHIREAKKDIPSMIINRAMKKHCFTDGYFDPTKCSFEVIACCLTQEGANDLEELLIKQENSHISNKKGYNVSNGGCNAPKTDAWRKQLSDWHASLTSEERAIRSEALSTSLRAYWATHDSPNIGRKWTPEQTTKFIKTRSENPIEYTPEIRQRMSDAHIGIKDTEKTKQKKSQMIKAAWDERNAVRYIEEDIRCHAPGCEVSGKHHYIILDGIRYCSMHGQRLRKHGSFEEKPRIAYNKGKKISEATRQKMCGKTPANKIFFSEDDINKILNDPRSANKVAKDFGVSKRVIRRIRQENQS